MCPRAFEPRRCTTWQYPREKYPAREEIRDAAPTGNWRSPASSLARSAASPACLTERVRLAATTTVVKSFLLKQSNFARYENEREAAKSLSFLSLFRERGNGRHFLFEAPKEFAPRFFSFSFPRKKRIAVSSEEGDCGYGVFGVSRKRNGASFF